MLRLYGNPRSRANRVHWTLEELEAPYEFYELDFTKGDHRSPFFLQLNPGAKIPVLTDDDFVLSESGAICNYLAEKFPEKRLIPPSGTRERGVYDQWLMFVLTELEQPLWTAGKHRFALPKQWRVPAIQPTAHFEFSKAVELLSQGLGEREFLAGDHFSVVDVIATHTLRWASNFKFDLAFPNVEAYLERHEARPAFQRMRAATPLEFPR